MNNNAELQKDYHRKFLAYKENYSVINPPFANNEGRMELPTPQLDVILSDLQNLVKEYTRVTIELENKLQSIYCMPELQDISKVKIEETKQEGDIISEIKKQINYFKNLKEKLEASLVHLSNII